MKTPRIVISLIFAISLLTPFRFLNAESVIVTVVYKGSEEQAYSVQGIKGTDVLLPIITNKSILLKADWSGSDKELYLNLQDPAIILPGQASATSTTFPGPLTVFSTRFPYAVGKKQLVYKAPDYSVWIQIDQDKE